MYFIKRKYINFFFLQNQNFVSLERFFESFDELKNNTSASKLIVYLLGMFVNV